MVQVHCIIQSVGSYNDMLIQSATGNSMRHWNDEGTLHIPTWFMFDSFSVKSFPQIEIINAHSFTQGEWAQGAWD